MDADKIKQLAGNLRHAAFTRKGATIGGGKFSPDECKAAAIALDAAPAMLAALQKIEGTLAADWQGDSLCLQHMVERAKAEARAAIAAATGER